MANWERLLLRMVGVGLLAVWPVRWALEGLPDTLLAVEGGGAWPLHLLAETITAALCLWAAISRGHRLVRPAALLALGALGYSCMNGWSYGAYGNAWHVGTAIAKLVAAVVVAQALSRDARVQGKRPARWPGVLVALVGLGMIGFWSMQVTVEGIMKDGLLSEEGNAYLIFHVSAEMLAGLVALIGGIGVLMTRRPGTALVGGGGVLYAALNSAGWALLNDPILGLVFAVCSLLIVLSAAALWRVAEGEYSLSRRAA